MNKILALQDVIIDVKRFVNEMNIYVYVTILISLSIMLMAIFKYVVKYAFNVSVVKRNVVKPLIFAVLIFVILLFLVLTRSQ